MSITDAFERAQAQQDQPEPTPRKPSYAAIYPHEHDRLSEHFTDGGWRWRIQQSKFTDLLIKIKSYANGDTWGCHPSQETLAEACGCSVATIRRRLAKLIQWGLIKRKTVKTNYGRHNRYTFPLDPRLCPDTAPTKADLQGEDTTDDGDRSSPNDMSGRDRSTPNDMSAQQPLEQPKTPKSSDDSEQGKPVAECIGHLSALDVRLNEGETREDMEDRLRTRLLPATNSANLDAITVAEAVASRIKDALCEKGGELHKQSGEHIRYPTRYLTRVWESCVCSCSGEGSISIEDWLQIEGPLVKGATAERRRDGETTTNEETEKQPIPKGNEVEHTPSVQDLAKHPPFGERETA